MTDLRTAAQQALEALEKCDAALAEELAAWDIDPPLHHVLEASNACGHSITALRAALAEPVQEPVATVTECEACFTPDVCQLRGTCDYYTASQMRIATAQPAPARVPPEWVDAVMDQAQVFASAWSLVGGRFDFGRGLEEAEIAKQELRAMLAGTPAKEAPHE